VSGLGAFFWVAWLALIWAWFWPQSVGKWAAKFHRGYKDACESGEDAKP